MFGTNSNSGCLHPKDGLLHLMSWNQEPALRHFKAFLPHLDADDSDSDWQHYNHVSLKRARGEQESTGWEMLSAMSRAAGTPVLAGRGM